ncbi:hypothetical protein T484DRAFT_3381182 [Baffinella frigidus]|nr:hypothetical protein T484DRAFT_3381182 [Cryptophyta sp. CCMP2293]
MATAVLCPTSWLFLRRTIGLCPLLLPEDKSEEAQKTGSWSVNTSSMHQFTGTLPVWGLGLGFSVQFLGFGV